MAKTKTRVKTRTSVRTKVAIAIAGGAILAAAAAGVYQVDRSSYLNQNVPLQEVVTVPQEATVRASGLSALAERSFTIAFDTSVDIPVDGSISIVLPGWLSTYSSLVYVNQNTFGTYSVVRNGRSLTVTRDGTGEVILAGKHVVVAIQRVRVVDPRYDGQTNTSVSVQYTQTTNQLPDLAVTDLYLEGVDGNVVTAMLKNQGGNTHSDSFDITIVAADQIDRTYLVSQLRDQSISQAGGTLKMQPGPLVSMAKVTVCIDTKNVVAESDEDNNCLTKNLIVNGAIAIDTNPEPNIVDVPTDPDAPTNTPPTDPVDAPADPDKGGSKDVSKVDSTTPADPPVRTQRTPSSDDDKDGELDTTNLIEVVKPNGGEIFTTGDTISIVWNADKSLTSTTVRFLDGKTFGPFIAKSNESGELEWIIPEDLVSKDLYIVVSAYDKASDRDVYDYGDAPFTVVASTKVTDEPTKDKVKDKDTDVVKDDGNTGGGGSGSGSGHGGGGGNSGGGLGTPNQPTLSKGFNNLIKVKCPSVAAYDVNHPCRTVYYHSRFGTRHAFPNEKVFFTWYNDFNDVRIIEKETMANIPLAKNVTYKPGVKMVKFPLSDLVYTVGLGGVLRGVETETLASQLYGATWNRQIDDISDAFFTDYTFGAPLISASQYNVSAAVQSTEFINDSL